MLFQCQANKMNSCFVTFDQPLYWNLAALPPTSAAARQDSLRVFHQVQLWRGVHLTETQWGWKVVCSNNLFPVATNDPITPQSLLNLIFCNCKSGCSKVCRCRKASLECTAMYGQCHGVSCSYCTQVVTVVEGDEFVDVDDIDLNWNSDAILYSGMEITINPDID